MLSMIALVFFLFGAALLIDKMIKACISSDIDKIQDYTTIALLVLVLGSIIFLIVSGKA